MKIVIGQINPIPGDFSVNVAQIKLAVQKAEFEKASVLVLPEMSIPGYLCRDSMYNEGFIQANLNALDMIRESTIHIPDLTVVVGYVEQNRTGVGKPFFNSAAVIQSGIVIANYRKQLLPFYDVFDEGRYFEPGKELTIIDIHGLKFGVIVCEDGWGQDKGENGYNYAKNPVEQYHEIGVANFIWLNSSPYVIGKPAHRERIGSNLSNCFNGGSIIIYANQVGGMDDLVFDGNSFVAMNGFVFSSCGNVQNNYVIDLNGNYGFQYTDDGIRQLNQYLISGLRDYIKKSGFQDVVVASSGGIDSALVLCLACEAIGADHVHAIRMPSIYSSKGSVDDALELHRNLGCHDYVVPIDHEPLLASINTHLGANTGLIRRYNYRNVADQNIQARLRAINLMHFSNAFGALALTTGNKSENATGYCTLGGDMMGGFAPIQDLYKTQVNAMSALYQEMPKAILHKVPSAELAPDQKDEEALMVYGILDLIIYAYVELRISTFNGFSAVDHKSFYPTFSGQHVVKFLLPFIKRKDAAEQYARIKRMIDINEFKRRQAAPGIKVSKVAFGTGRRFPIVKKMW